MKIILSLFLVMSFFLNLTEGSAMEKKLSYKEEIMEKFKGIDFLNGINKEEAIIISQKYLLDTKRDSFLVISRIRMVDGATHSYGQDYWLISFATTFKVRMTQGLQWGGVLVNKKTGVTEYIGEGPS